MTMDSDIALELSAEEYDRASFSSKHKFSEHDERIIRKLIAHGPVLLQGSRGTGKSALLIEASLRLAPALPESPVIGLYISLRYVPLLRADGEEYERLFCNWVSKEVSRILDNSGIEFPNCSEVVELREAFANLNADTGKRIVLLFDDAAHIGRETSLGAFFDLFRTLSSHTLCCKAAIYPGVTEFGTRFDIYNDATVIDASRSPDRPGFAELFAEVLAARYPQLTQKRNYTFGFKRFAELLATSVLGNVRGFIFACNDLVEHSNESSIGYNVVGESFKRLAAEYYWPLLEEVTPKLGKYTPAAETAHELAEILLTSLGAGNSSFALIHKAHVMRLAKPLEILEYVGFISRRQASRSMKSGGRGVLYAVNLCTLLEKVSGGRLTATQVDAWLNPTADPIEFHERSEPLKSLVAPLPLTNRGLDIFGLSIEKLAVSQVYPYGLTDHKLQILKDKGYLTIGQLADATETQLMNIEGIGKAAYLRIRSVLGQAIWM